MRTKVVWSVLGVVLVVVVVVQLLCCAHEFFCTRSGFGGFGGSSVVVLCDTKLFVLGFADSKPQHGLDAPAPNRVGVLASCRRIFLGYVK